MHFRHNEWGMCRNHCHVNNIHRVTMYLDTYLIPIQMHATPSMLKLSECLQKICWVIVIERIQL